MCRKLVCLMVVVLGAGVVSNALADSNTIGLWLFDETDYPHTTLTDASEYEYDLCLMDSGHLAGGKFGNALQISGSSFTSAYAGFKGSVPLDEMRASDGTASGLWGPTVAPEKILNALAGTNWTCEFWLKLPAAPGSAVFVLDVGDAYAPGANVVLAGGGGSFGVEDSYAGFRADCPTNAAQLTNGQWHHVAFTYNAGSGQFRHYLDGQLQATPTITTIAVQPTPAIIWPTSLDHDSFGFTASSPLEWRRQHRFNITVGHARLGLMAMSGMVDELRLSDVVRYSGNFALPGSFSRNYGSSPAVPTGPPLLFPGGVPSAPVQLGARKYVFIDDVLLESKVNVQITMNPAGNRQQLSIAVENSSWRPAIFEKDGKVYIFIPDGYSSPEGIVRLRWSTDGINFVTPNWGVIDYKGSTNNDFIFYRTPMYGMAFDDLNPNVAAEEQFKITAWVANRGIYLYTSSDGVHWRRNETCMLPLVSGGEAETYWDDQRGRYCDFLKRDSSYNNSGCGGSGRRAVLFESTEVSKTWPFVRRPNPYFEGWPFPAVTCEGPIAMPTTAAGQVYRTRAMKYPYAPDTYLAFVWRFPSDDSRKVDLGVSRDGVNWKFFATSESGPWYIGPYGSYVEAMSLYGMIRRGDEFWQYAEYGTGPHGDGARIYSRLTQRLDGFVSLNAGATTGTGTTRQMVFDGDELVLNVAATGRVRVGILDAAGVPRPGFDVADCDPIVGDSVRQLVSWNGDSDVSGLAGTVVRLKFEMQNARLYALQFMSSLKAYSPVPADGAEDVSLDTELCWAAGEKAGWHDVYFGTDFNDVNDATTADQSGVYRGRQPLADINCAPPVPLDYDRTYYWRVDEVNEPNMWKGKVWSFTTGKARASNPSPADGAEGLPRQGVQLGWSAGFGAVSHDVYLGTNPITVKNATTSSVEYKGSHERDANSYAAGPFELGRTYYWRIDEVNLPDKWKGNVWKFTAQDLLVVDDMEDYDVYTLCDTWVDGVENGTGSWIMLVSAPACLVHGGVKSIWFDYNNNFEGYAKYSEIYRKFADPCDWTAPGTEILTLYFYGDPGNDASQQLYAGLEDGRGAASYAGVKYGDMNDVTEAEWQQWDIALRDFGDAGVNLGDVNRLYIGFGDRDNPQPGGRGSVYVDDIQLYPRRCTLPGPQADLTSDCVVEFKDYAVLANQWRHSPGSPSADIAPEPPDGIVDIRDLAVLTDSWLVEAWWP